MPLRSSKERMNALTESARAFIPRAQERSRYERFHPLGAPDSEQVTERPESNGKRLIPVVLLGGYSEDK